MSVTRSRTSSLTSNFSEAVGLVVSSPVLRRLASFGLEESEPALAVAVAAAAAVGDSRARFFESVVVEAGAEAAEAAEAPEAVEAAGVAGAEVVDLESLLSLSSKPAPLD